MKKRRFKCTNCETIYDCPEEDIPLICSGCGKILTHDKLENKRSVQFEGVIDLKVHIEDIANGFLVTTRGQGLLSRDFTQFAKDWKAVQKIIADFTKETNLLGWFQEEGDIGEQFACLYLVKSEIKDCLKSLTILKIWKRRKTDTLILFG